MTDYTGKQLGNYCLTRLLGQGGFAEVYLGKHIVLETMAAIKILHTRVTEEDVAEFQQEARLLASLKHPHIIRVLDFGIDGQTPYLVMDYAPNGTLRTRHPKETIPPVSTVVDYVKQIAEALQYAHDRKIVHRDIKPQNMLIGEKNEILLSDFGIAVIVQSSRHHSTKDMAGTITYMAPEQIETHPHLASDQYSLGIVAYEWLCGKRPFDGSLTEIAIKHRVTPPPSLTRSMPSISPEIENVVFRALAKDPAARFPKVRDFALALSDASDISSAPALPSPPLSIESKRTVPLSTSSPNPSFTPNLEPVPSPPVQTPSRSSPRRAFLIAGFAASLTTLGGAVWWTLLRSQSSPIQTTTCVPAKGLIANEGLLTPGVLSWGADPGVGSAPYVYLDANSAPIGFEVDIANAITQRMGITQVCYLTRYKWDIEKDLQSRKMDIILNGWEITPGRQWDEAFSIPYYRSSQQLVVRANDSRFSQYTAVSQIALGDVDAYKFGTGADYKAADLLRAAGITLSTFDVPLRDLNKGSVDIIMVDTPIVAYYVQGRGKGASPSHTLRPIGKPLYADATSNYVIGFKKNDPNADTLRKEIDQVLHLLKQDGTLKRIYEQWGLWNDFQKEIGITDSCL